MRLLLDEMLSPVIARELQALSGNYRRTKSDTGRIIATLEARLIQYPADEALANAEEWL